METPYELLDVTPLFDCGSLCVLSFNLELQREKKHVVTFLDFALAFSPKEKGKILIGQMQYHEDKYSGPSCDVGESTMDAVAFIREMYGEDRNLHDEDRNAMRLMSDDVIIQIITDRLIKDHSGLSELITNMKS